MNDAEGRNIICEPAHQTMCKEEMNQKYENTRSKKDEHSNEIKGGKK